MRVLVVSDTVGALSALQAAQAIAEGWAAQGAEVAAVPMGEAGRGVGQAVADIMGRQLQLSVATPAPSAPHASVANLLTFLDADDDVALVSQDAGQAPAARVPLDATSLSLGEQLRVLLERHPRRRVVIDLGGLDVHDGGAGLLAGLGARADHPLDAGVAGLSGVSAVDCSAPRTLIGDADLLGVVPTEELDRQLLGLRGVTSMRGHVVGLDQDVMLRTDEALADWAQALGADAGQPGAGACGGAGLAVLALGGRLLSGPQLCAGLVDLERTLPLADLVVAGCAHLDFVRRGGDVIGYLAQRAAVHTKPLVVLASTVAVSGRELRTFGVEAAYPVHPGRLPADAPTVARPDVERLAARVAGTWSW